VTTLNGALGGEANQTNAASPGVHYDNSEASCGADDHGPSPDVEFLLGTQVRQPEISEKVPQSADTLHANRLVPQSVHTKRVAAQKVRQLFQSLGTQDLL